MYCCAVDTLVKLSLYNEDNCPLFIFTAFWIDIPYYILSYDIVQHVHFSLMSRSPALFLRIKPHI